MISVRGTSITINAFRSSQFIQFTFGLKKKIALLFCQKECASIQLSKSN